MSNKDRVGGIIFLKVDGDQYRVKGSWTYNIGKPKREGVVGSDGMHGFTEKPQVPFVEGVITDRGDMSIEALMDTKDATLVLELANGKVIQQKGSYWAADGNVTTEAGEIEARFEGMSSNEIR